MHIKDVSSLLIVEGKKPVGIITERDIVQAMAKEIDPSPQRRELDMLMSVGERVSMSLLSMAIQKLGHEAI